MSDVGLIHNWLHTYSIKTIIEVNLDIKMHIVKYKPSCARV